MITALNRWSGEGDSSEIECKDGFQKHDSTQGRSDWSRCIEESEMMTLVQKGEKSCCFILWMPRVHNYGVSEKG
jgi:hypothetical protein